MFKVQENPLVCLLFFELTCLTVHKVNYPRQNKDLTTESDISVCFERGGKIAASRTQKIQVLTNGSIEIVFNEPLSLVVTMYRDESGKFQVNLPFLTTFFHPFIHSQF